MKHNDLMGDWRRTHYSSEINGECIGKIVTMAGWINEMRNLGGICFLGLRDRNGICQVTLEKGMMPERFDVLVSLPRESIIMVRGEIKENSRAPGGFEIIPNEVKVLSKAKTPLPLGVVDQVFAELDTRLDNRYIDLRKMDKISIFKLKHKVAEAVSRIMSQEGFINVQTPKVVATATEGGTNLFKVDYFGRDAYLTQSPQLYKQTLMSAGFDRVSEIAPAFRAEEHDTVRHLNEFTSIDIEMSFSDENDAMDVLELIMKEVVKELHSSRQEIEEINRGRKKLNKLINKLNMNIGKQNKQIKKENQKLKKSGGELKPLLKPKELFDALVIEPIEGKIPRIRYSECLEMARKGGIDVDFGEDLSMEAMKVVAKIYPGYFFITHWPTSIKPFYVQPYEDEPELCRAFDLNKGWYELASGAQRVHDVELLVSNLQKAGLNPESFSSYLDPFRYGMPPHAGWGVGLERIMLAVSGEKNVREVVLFPRDKYRLTP